MIEVVKDLKPLPGAKEFLDWLKPLVPRILLLTELLQDLDILYSKPMSVCVVYQLTKLNINESQNLLP